MINPKCEVGESRNGRGVFARSLINEGELIVDWIDAEPPVGRIIGLTKARRLFRSGKDYLIQINERQFFAALNDDEQDASDWINHACIPNCGFVSSLRLAAMRPILPGEEITFDYAMSESAKFFRMKCRCGCINCRKMIIGNDWKLRELQRRYYLWFSPYLQRKIPLDDSIQGSARYQYDLRLLHPRG
jgi:SET domain-containing protein